MDMEPNSIPDPPYKKSPANVQRFLPNLIAFAIGLGIAYILKWKTTDLVWSLWLCSLTLGYATILSAISGGAYIGINLIHHEDFDRKHRKIAIFAGLAAVLFLLGFFSIHFCGFHAGHSIFLSMFFPVEGMPKDGFGEAFMNPFLLWILVFRHLIKPYGIFLIPAFIVERKHVFGPLIKAVKTVRHDENVLDFKASDKASRGKNKDRLSMEDVISRPYKNVIRMHLLIFFFAFCHFLKIDSFTIYAVVYSVYFFPWSEIRNKKAKAEIRNI